MDTQRVAELKRLLVGVPLPAEKPQLLAYAVQQRAEPDLVMALRTLPDREYESLDEVAEELLRVQPARRKTGPREPRTESGEPPGGDAYARD